MGLCFPLSNNIIEIPQIYEVCTFPRDKSLNSVTFSVHGPWHQDTFMFPCFHLTGDKETTELHKAESLNIVRLHSQGEKLWFVIKKNTLCSN